MNQFFYESRGREKVKNLLMEGQRSQALHISNPPKNRLRSKLPRFGLVILGILGALVVLIR